MAEQKATDFIFLAVPFGVKMEALREAVNLAASELGRQVLHPGKFGSAASFEQVVRDAIDGASLVIADVTGVNPNVMWELGYAQALRKPVLLLTQDPGKVPFDLRSTRVLSYQTKTELSHLTARLRDAIAQELAEPGRQPTLTAAQTGRRHRAFFSYSHSDSEYLDRILIHLRPAERSGAIDLWSDTKLRAGDRWRDEIRQAVAEARVAVILVSADFLASEFVVSDELPPLLAAAETEGARIIPVILKPSRFLREDRLARFHAINDPMQPVIRMNEADREELYARLAEVVEAEIEL